MTTSYRLVAGLATIALAVGATTAFADGGPGGSGGSGGSGGRHGRHGRDDHAPKGETVIRSAVFGSQPTGPVLFGVNPGGALWVINRGSAVVRRNGRVKVRVEGLVIPTPPQNGTNPLTAIAATVYCGATAVATTSAVPFSTAGDARIDETLAKPLPRPCLAPAVLLNPAPGGTVNAGVYIAATGA